MTTGLKVKSFNGVTKIAPANIEARSTETALREAQYALDMMLHDLRSEFIQREFETAPRLPRPRGSDHGGRRVKGSRK